MKFKNKELAIDRVSQVITSIIISTCIALIYNYTNITLINASIIAIIIGIVFNLIIAFILKKLYLKDKLS